MTFTKLDDCTNELPIKVAILRPTNILCLLKLKATFFQTSSLSFWVGNVQFPFSKLIESQKMLWKNCMYFNSEY